MGNEILLVPPPSFMGNRIFEIDNQHRSYENIKPIQELRGKLAELGYSVNTIDMAKGDISSAYAVVFFEVPRPSDKYYQLCLRAGMQDRMYFIVGEPPAVRPDDHDPSLHNDFKGVMTFNSDLVDDKKYFRWNYTIPIRLGEKITTPKAKLPFEQKKLLCLISSNKFSSYRKELYGERINAIRFMENHHPGDFDLHGTGWEKPMIHQRLASALKINGAIWRFWPKSVKIKQFKTYRGSPQDKAGVYPRYRFTIAYENCITNGFISEKILEAMLYGTVPIYLGDPNVQERIPKDCFIDKREFSGNYDDSGYNSHDSGYESLYRYISGMDKKTHEDYLDRIEKFLNSDKVYPFTMDAYVDSFKKMLGIAERQETR